MVFLAFGLLVGPGALGLLDLTVRGELLESVAELTLALILFTDSANADLRTLRRTFRVPQRLLLIGLPLTIALGFGVGAAYGRCSPEPPVGVVSSSGYRTWKALWISHPFTTNPLLG